MKMLVFLLILLGVVVFASMYVKQNPLQLNLLPTKLINPKSASTSAIAPPVVCNKTPIPDVTEGPNYISGSPEKIMFRDPATPGTHVTLSGVVTDSDCNPISRAWLDFWHADATGKYDNEGFTLRGHQYTDTKGRYTLHTVIPGENPGRTPHIHVKVRANDYAPITTTQLFIPGIEKNPTDTLFKDTLLMDVKDVQGGKLATYDFVIKTQ